MSGAAELATYRFPATGSAIRVVDVDGEPWFVASDACAILGHTNTSKAVKMLDEDERQTLRLPRSEGITSEHPLADQRVHQLIIVSEPGLYTLMVRSQVPGAVAFRRWVTHEVLPAIRKTGSYSVANLSRRELAQLVIDEADRADAAEQRAAALEPAAEAWETLASATGDYSLRDAAFILCRDHGIETGRNRLMAFLRKEHLVDSNGIPYARYARYLVERPSSYIHPRTGERILKKQIRITVDGVAFLRKRLGGTGKDRSVQLALVAP